MEGCVMGGGRGDSDSEAYVNVGLQWLCHQAVSLFMIMFHYL